MPAEASEAVGLTPDQLEDALAGARRNAVPLKLVPQTDEWSRFTCRCLEGTDKSEAHATLDGLLHVRVAHRPFLLGLYRRRFAADFRQRSTRLPIRSCSYRVRTRPRAARRARRTPGRSTGGDSEPDLAPARAREGAA